MGLAEVQEEEIKARIATKLGNTVECEVVPEKTVDFKRSITTKPVITVAYSGADYPALKSTNEVSQTSEETFEIMIRAKLLRGTNGVYDLKDKIRKAVVGFTPSSCGKIYLKSFKLENFEENLWMHSFRIACTSLNVEDFSEEPGVPITEAKATFINSTYN